MLPEPKQSNELYYRHLGTKRTVSPLPSASRYRVSSHFCLPHRDPAEGLSLTVVIFRCSQLLRSSYWHSLNGQ